MRTHVASTSRDAYHAHAPKLPRQQATIVSVMASQCHRDFTRSELARATGLRLSSVCGRAAELLERQVLTEGPRRPCRLTGIECHPLRLVPAQVELFS